MSFNCQKYCFARNISLRTASHYTILSLKRFAMDPPQRRRRHNIVLLSVRPRCDSVGQDSNIWRESQPVGMFCICWEIVSYPRKTQSGVIGCVGRDGGSQGSRIQAKCHDPLRLQLFVSYHIRFDPSYVKNRVV